MVLILMALPLCVWVDLVLSRVSWVGSYAAVAGLLGGRTLNLSLRLLLLMAMMGIRLCVVYDRCIIVSWNIESSALGGTARRRSSTIFGMGRVCVDERCLSQFSVCDVERKVTTCI